MKNTKKSMNINSDLPERPNTRNPAPKLKKCAKPGDGARIYVDGDYGNPMLVYGTVVSKNGELFVKTEGYASGCPYENLSDYSAGLYPISEAEEIIPYKPFNPKDYLK